MTVTLPPDVAKAVKELVEDGFYPSPEAVLGAAMIALAQKMEYVRKRAELRAELDKGLEDLEAGRYTELTPEWAEQMKQRVRQRAADRRREEGAA